MTRKGKRRLTNRRSTCSHPIAAESLHQSRGGSVWPPLRGSLVRRSPANTQLRKATRTNRHRRHADFFAYVKYYLSDHRIMWAEFSI
jgi:hypothetical protein